MVTKHFVQGPAQNVRSKFRGVYWDKRSRCWQAFVLERGTHQYVGTFAAEEDAARAYDNAAVERCGDCTKLNYPHQLVRTTICSTL
jgi:hypothetical protein